MSNKSAARKRGSRRAGKQPVKGSNGNLAAPAQVLDLALGIIRELLAGIDAHDYSHAVVRAENFLALVEAQR